MPQKSATESKETKNSKQHVEQSSISKTPQTTLKEKPSPVVEPIDQEYNAKDFLQIAGNALIAEYNAIRAASLARDQVFSSVANFGIVLLVAILASLPTVISQQRYQLLLPLFSIIASTLALTTLSQRWLVETLARYEIEELSARLQALFQLARKPELLPNNLARYWQWQSFLKHDRNKGILLTRFGRFIASAAPGTLPIFASLGFIYLFIYHRAFDNLTLPENFLFYLAVIYGLFTLLVYGAFLYDKIRSYT
jgi:hypothetical protein